LFDKSLGNMKHKNSNIENLFKISFDSFGFTAREKHSFWKVHFEIFLFQKCHRSQLNYGGIPRN